MASRGNNDYLILVGCLNLVRLHPGAATFFGHLTSSMPPATAGPPSIAAASLLVPRSDRELVVYRLVAVVDGDVLVLVNLRDLLSNLVLSSVSIR